MCFDAIVSGIGAVRDAGNARASQRRSAQEEARQRAFTAEANNRVGAVAGQVAASNPDAARTSTSDALLAALRNSGLLNGGANFGAPGAVSARFKRDTAAARGATQAENVGAVDRLSRIDAPAYQRTGEARMVANAQSDLARIGSRSAGESYLARLRLAGINGGSGG